MTNDSGASRPTSMPKIEDFYSIEFSVKGEALLLHFKLWNLPGKGTCIPVKNGSVILRRMKAGDVLEMKYFKESSKVPSEPLPTKITQIVKDEEGRFPGHYLVCLSIVEENTFEGQD